MISFAVLGPLVVRLGDTSLAINTPMLRRLLALLLCRPGMIVSTDSIVDALWGETPPSTAKKTLQVYIHRLRSVLHHKDRILHTTNGYVLKVLPNEIDSLVFSELVAKAATLLSDGELRAAKATLESALQLWRGHPFPEIHDISWAASEANRLAELRLDALEARTSIDLELGLHKEVINELRAAIAEHPYREKLRGDLMLALYRSGRQAEALETYRQTRALLVSELGIEPVAELQDLYQRLLRGDPGLSAGAQPSERDGPSSWRFLPHDPHDFTGRQLALEWLDAVSRMQGSPAVLSAIAGGAGVGKTALAVRWAHRSAPRFPDGQLYINLQGYAQTRPLLPIEGLTHLLRCLGAEPDKIPADVESAAALYRSMLSGKRVSILLDNALGVDQVRPLLPGEQGCFVIITSRDRLSGLIAREGAKRLILDVLPADEALALLHRIVGPERIEADTAAAARLVELCGSLPLALRIAGAHLVDHPTTAISEYASALATTGRMDSLIVDGDEQFAIKAVLSYSYNSLEPPMQGIFGWLSLIPGPDFTLSAVTALTGLTAGQAADALETLCGAHLLDGHHAGRFSFHDLVREYASTTLEHMLGLKDQHDSLTNLLTWYRDVTNAADRLLRPAERPNFGSEPDTGIFNDDPDLATAWLEAESANLGAAVMALGDSHPRLAWQLAAAMFGWLMRRGQRNKWIELYEQAVKCADRAGDLDGEALLTGRLAIPHAMIGNTDQAAAACLRAYELRVEQGDRLGAANTLLNLGAVFVNANRPVEAIDWLEQARSLGQDLPNNRHLMTVIASNVAEALSLAGRKELSIETYEKALSNAQGFLADRDIAQMLIGLSAARNDSGDHSGAMTDCLRGYELARHAGDEALAAEGRVQLGRIYMSIDAPAEALEYLEGALTTLTELGHRSVAELRQLLSEMDTPRG